MDLLSGHEIIVGTYEEFVMGFQPSSSGDFTKSFIDHTHSATVKAVAAGCADLGNEDLARVLDGQSIEVAGHSVSAEYSSGRYKTNSGNSVVPPSLTSIVW